MNGRGHSGKEKKQKRSWKARAALQQHSKQKREGERDQHSGEKHDAVETRLIVNESDRQVVQPLPRIPRRSAHGGGEGIGARNRMPAENLLTAANVPTCACVTQQARRENAIAQ